MDRDGPALHFVLGHFSGESGHRLIDALAAHERLQARPAVIPTTLHHGLGVWEGVGSLGLVLGAEEPRQQRIDARDAVDVDLCAHRRLGQENPLLRPFRAEPELHELDGRIELGGVFLHLGSHTDGGGFLQLDGCPVWPDRREGSEFHVILQVRRRTLVADFIIEGPGAVQIERGLFGDEKGHGLLPGDLKLIVGDPLVVDEQLHPAEGFLDLGGVELVVRQRLQATFLADNDIVPRVTAAHCPGGRRLSGLLDLIAGIHQLIPGGRDRADPRLAQDAHVPDGWHRREFTAQAPDMVACFKEGVFQQGAFPGGILVHVAFQIQQVARIPHFRAGTVDDVGAVPCSAVGQ